MKVDWETYCVPATMTSLDPSQGLIDPILLPPDVANGKGAKTVLI